MVGHLILLAALLLAPNEAFASNLVDLRDVTINYRNYNSASRNPLFTETKLHEGLAVSLGIDWANWFYWDNTIQGLTDDGQYRAVSLQSQLGVRIHRNLSIEYYHRSEHLLDSVYPYSKWPVEDALSIRLFIYRRDEPSSKTLF